MAVDEHGRFPLTRPEPFAVDARVTTWLEYFGILNTGSSKSLHDPVGGSAHVAGVL
jgi:hypothetical protein